jgi:hypothetical protein
MSGKRHAATQRGCIFGFTGAMGIVESLGEADLR